MLTIADITYRYHVEIEHYESDWPVPVWEFHSAFPDKDDAIKEAEQLARLYPHVRVIDTKETNE